MARKRIKMDLPAQHGKKVSKKLTKTATSVMDSIFTAIRNITGITMFVFTSWLVISTSLRYWREAQYLDIIKNADPVIVETRLLRDPLDLTVAMPIPTTPLANVSFPKANRYLDTTNYHLTEPRALHGGLAKGFPQEDIPALELSLDREFPDFRDASCLTSDFYNPSVVATLPSASVVIIFADEPFETLMRSVHSVLNNSPPDLLKEIILVDDGSSSEYITKDGGLLETYIAHLPKVFLTRTGSRTGIMRARTHGILKTTSEIFVILDSHVEAEPGWLEPLIYRVNEEPLSFVTPLIDSIVMAENYKPVNGGIPCHLGVIWRLQDHAFTPNATSPKDRLSNDRSKATSSPVMAGGLFAASKAAFLASGGYDLGMGAWGAENVELGFRLWMCGGRIDCMPCSRVAHIFDRGQVYSGGLQTRQGQLDYNKNRLRTAAVWMDEFAGLPHQVLGKPDWTGAGDTTEMMQLRKNLECKNFKWFLETVWPESHVVSLDRDLPYDGPILSMKHKDACLFGGHSASFMVHRGSVLGVGNTPVDQCPWFLFFKKIGAIASGFDDETILVNKNEHLEFDWNSDGRDFRSNWTVNKEQDNGDSHIVSIRFHGKCLTLVGESSMTVKLKPCGKKASEEQLWSWRLREVAMDPTNHYEHWLIGQ